MLLISTDIDCLWSTDYTSWSERRPSLEQKRVQGLTTRLEQLQIQTVSARYCTGAIAGLNKVHEH